MKNALYVLWIIPLLGAGMISAATCIKLFVMWRRSRKEYGSWGEPLTGIQCLMSLGLTAGSFFWWWAMTYLGATPVPWEYSWRQLVSRTWTVAPTLMWACYVFDVFGWRSRTLDDRASAVRHFALKRRFHMKNWKTTVTGAGFGILTLFLQGGFTTPEGKVNWAALGISAGLATIGALAKDYNVTGGTVAQTTTVRPVVEPER